MREDQRTGRRIPDKTLLPAVGGQLHARKKPKVKSRVCLLSIGDHLLDVGHHDHLVMIRDGNGLQTLGYALIDKLACPLHPGGIYVVSRGFCACFLDDVAGP